MLCLLCPSRCVAILWTTDGWESTKQKPWVFNSDHTSLTKKKKIRELEWLVQDHPFVNKWQNWDVNPICQALQPNSGQRGGGCGVLATGGISEMNSNLFPTALYHLALLNKIKGSHPNKCFLSWIAKESDVWTTLCASFPPQKEQKNANSAFCQI